MASPTFLRRSSSAVFTSAIRSSPATPPSATPSSKPSSAPFSALSRRAAMGARARAKVGGDEIRAGGEFGIDREALAQYEAGIARALFEGSDLGPCRFRVDEIL